jgi:hypothetical protein
MSLIESIQTVNPKGIRVGDDRAKAHGRLDKPNRILFPRRQRLERFPTTERVSSTVSRFVRIIENRETNCFEGEFSFKLTGVVLNGRFLGFNDQSVKGKGTTGDRLMSRLLPLLDGNANMRFVFGGGGEANFEWIIQGITRNAKSKEAAEAAAMTLRRDLQMILPSEPCFRFDPVRQSAKQTGECWQTCIEPSGISLRIPAKTDLGFADYPKAADLQDIILHLAIPRPGLPSFHSLAEAVIRNPNPVSVEVTLGSYELDGQAQMIVSDALKWMEANPVGLRRQLSALKLGPAFSEHLQNQLQAWLQNPAGERLECRINSSALLNDSFVQMVGEDVFGARVKFGARTDTESDESANLAASKEHQPNLNLVGCLHPELAWPFLFPNVDALANARVKRLYNLDVPGFSNNGILLGHVAECRRHRVRVSEQDRSQPQYVLGATGTGKSTLLFNMMIQDIRAGHGVGLIDPHGDLYDQLLEAVPLSRANDVFLFNPGNPDFSPGINPLECNGPNRSMQVNFAVNEMLKTFERLYDMRICGGPMFETYFRNAMLLLMESGLEEVTLTELSLVFEDADYRKFLKSRCKNPLVVGFWTNQAERVKGDAALENLAPYIVSKINAFTCNAIIRPIIGQARSTIDFRRVIDGHGIFLARLTKGALGELDTQLLGSFLLSKIFIAAMGRTSVKPGQRNVFHLYVDEFQNFTNDTIAHMLSEARKYGLYLTLANQNLSQLDANQGYQNLADAVLGNIGNMVTFRVGPSDAEKLHAYTLPEFNALDLQGLPNYHAIARLMTAEGPTRPFVFKTLPAIKPRGYAIADHAVWNARAQACSSSVAEVEAQILQRRSIHKNPKETEIKRGAFHN